MPQNSHGSPVEALVRSASRRRHGLLFLEQFSYAVALVLSGAILMLLLGTQILHWYWLVLLAAGGITLVVFRLRGRLLTKYQIAQVLDQRLRLADTLSTAWFLLETPSRSNVQAQLQMRQAEELAKSVQPRAAFPLQGQRGWAVTAILLVIACGLFSVRYLIADRLSFQQALIPIHFRTVIEQLQTKLGVNAKYSPDSQAKRELSRYDASGRSPFQREESGDRNGTKSGNTGATPGEQANDSRTGQKDGTQPDNDARASDMRHENRLQADSADPSGSAAKERQQPRPLTNGRPDDNGKEANKEQAANNSPQEPSLASKMRDALSGLLQKMHLGSRPAPAGQEDGRSTGAKQGKNQTASDKDPQAGSEEDGSDQTEEASSRQAQAQSANSSAKVPGSQSEGADQSAGQRGSDAQSAAGRQDGSKETREAEQLKAMGKLAEIIGKRSNDVTGDMSVETFSGKQQLQTPDTQRLGQHSGLGGEINRNEVPLEDQKYVREYMKQVHEEQNNR